MPATAADIAAFTREGVDIEEADLTIKSAHRDAIDLGNQVQQTFVRDVGDAETLLAERFTLLSTIEPFHHAVEVDERLAIGTSIAVGPEVPNFRIVQDSKDIDVVARMRAFAYDTETDRMSVEVIE